MSPKKSGGHRVPRLPLRLPIPARGRNILTRPPSSSVHHGNHAGRLPAVAIPVAPPRTLQSSPVNECCNGACLHRRSEEHTSELQSLMRISYAVFCLQKKKKHKNTQKN